jgi:hypothetical protein
MRMRSLTPLRLGLFVLALAFCAPLAFGQMPQPNKPKPLSSDDVSDAELKKAARVAVALQSSGRKMKMEMQKEMKEKYGNPSELDSTQKSEMRREVRKQQKEMRMKQMKTMRKKAKEEGIKPKRVRRILQSTRQDKELKQRFRKAVKAEMAQQAPQMNGGKKKGGGSSNQ